MEQASKEKKFVAQLLSGLVKGPTRQKESFLGRFSAFGLGSLLFIFRMIPFGLFSVLFLATCPASFPFLALGRRHPIGLGPKRAFAGGAYEPTTITNVDGSISMVSYMRSKQAAARPRFNSRVSRSSAAKAGGEDTQPLLVEVESPRNPRPRIESGTEETPG